MHSLNAAHPRGWALTTHDNDGCPSALRVFAKANSTVRPCTGQYVAYLGSAAVPGSCRQHHAKIAASMRLPEPLSDRPRHATQLSQHHRHSGQSPIDRAK